ncbi:unnamed protein product [Boreogadus saida]
MENDTPCVMGAQFLPVATTGRAGEPAAAYRPLVARTAVRLPNFSGATALEPYLAQFCLAEWHNGWGAEEAVDYLALALVGTAARVLLDLDQADQRDLQALTRALERRFGERIFSNQSRQLLASQRRREEESLGGSLLRGLVPECLGQHVRLTEPKILDAALDLAERSRQRKNRVQTATLPATETAEAAHALWLHDRADLEPQQCQQLGLVEDCGWTGQRATHPRPSRRCGRRRERRLRAAEDGVPERRSRAPYSGTWWGLRWRWSPTTPPGLLWTVGDGRPNQGGRLPRNGAATGRGQGGGGAGPLNSRDYVLGVGVDGTSDP